MIFSAIYFNDVFDRYVHVFENQMIAVSFDVKFEVRSSELINIIMLVNIIAFYPKR